VSPETAAAILAALRDVRTRAQARIAHLDETVQTMEDLGFQVARLSDGPAVVEKVLEIIPEGSDVVSHPSTVGRILHLDDALRQAGRKVVALPGDGEPYRQNGQWRDQVLAAQFGITGANAVVADTGSLALIEDLGFGRAASNVPPVHIALVTADSIVEDLLDAATIARGYASLHLHKALPRYMSVISGPSKTADIGLTLVRGMHGPRTVHVLIWERPKAEGANDDALRAWVLS
jgi:LUD domain